MQKFLNDRISEGGSLILRNPYFPLQQEDLFGTGSSHQAAIGALAAYASAGAGGATSNAAVGPTAIQQIGPPSPKQMNNKTMLTAGSAAAAGLTNNTSNSKLITIPWFLNSVLPVEFTGAHWEWKMQEKLYEFHDLWTTMNLLPAFTKQQRKNYQKKHNEEQVNLIRPESESTSLKWLLLAGRLINMLFWTTVLIRIYYADDGTCEKTPLQYDCISRKTMLGLGGVHLCIWDPTLDTACSFNQHSIDNFLQLAFLVAAVILLSAPLEPCLRILLTYYKLMKLYKSKATSSVIPSASLIRNTNNKKVVPVKSAQDTNNQQLNQRSNLPARNKPGSTVANRRANNRGSPVNNRTTNSNVRNAGIVSSNVKKSSVVPVVATSTSPSTAVAVARNNPFALTTQQLQANYYATHLNAVKVTKHHELRTAAWTDRRAAFFRAARFSLLQAHCDKINARNETSHILAALQSKADSTSASARYQTGYQDDYAEKLLHQRYVPSTLTRQVISLYISARDRYRLWLYPALDGNNTDHHRNSLLKRIATWILPMRPQHSPSSPYDTLINDDHLHHLHSLDSLYAYQVYQEIRQVRIDAKDVRRQLTYLERDTDRDTYLLQQFLIEQLPYVQRCLAMGHIRRLFLILELDISPQFLQLLFVLIGMYLLFAVAFTIAFTLQLGSKSANYWLLIVSLCIACEWLFLQPGRLFLHWIISSMSFMPTIRYTHALLKARCSSILTRHYGMIATAASEYSLIQHFSTACRVARLFPELSSSRLFMSLHDQDIRLDKFAPYLIKQLTFSSRIAQLLTSIVSVPIVYCFPLVMQEMAMEIWITVLLLTLSVGVIALMEISIVPAVLILGGALLMTIFGTIRVAYFNDDEDDQQDHSGDKVAAKYRTTNKVVPYNDTNQQQSEMGHGEDNNEDDTMNRMEGAATAVTLKPLRKKKSSARMMIGGGRRSLFLNESNNKSSAAEDDLTAETEEEREARLYRMRARQMLLYWNQAKRITLDEHQAEKAKLYEELILIAKGLLPKPPKVSKKKTAAAQTSAKIAPAPITEQEPATAAVVASAAASEQDEPSINLAVLDEQPSIVSQESSRLLLPIGEEPSLGLPMEETQPVDELDHHLPAIFQVKPSPVKKVISITSKDVIVPKTKFHQRLLEEKKQKLQQQANNRQQQEQQEEEEKENDEFAFTFGEDDDEEDDEEEAKEPHAGHGEEEEEHKDNDALALYHEKKFEGKPASKRAKWEFKKRVNAILKTLPVAEELQFLKGHYFQSEEEYKKAKKVSKPTKEQIFIPRDILRKKELLKRQQELVAEMEKDEAFTLDFHDFHDDDQEAEREYEEMKASPIKLPAIVTASKRKKLASGLAAADAAAVNNASIIERGVLNYTLPTSANSRPSTTPNRPPTTSKGVTFATTVDIKQLDPLSKEELQIQQRDQKLKELTNKILSATSATTTLRSLRKAKRQAEMITTHEDATLLHDDQHMDVDKQRDDFDLHSIIRQDGLPDASADIEGDGDGDGQRAISPSFSAGGGGAGIMRPSTASIIEKHQLEDQLLLNNFFGTNNNKANNATAVVIPDGTVADGAAGMKAALAGQPQQQPQAAMIITQRVQKRAKRMLEERQQEREELGLFHDQAIDEVTGDDWYDSMIYDEE